MRSWIIIACLLVSGCAAAEEPAKPTEPAPTYTLTLDQAQAVMALVKQDFQQAALRAQADQALVKALTDQDPHYVIEPRVKPEKKEP